MDFWFGTACSSKTKKVQRPVDATRCASYMGEVKAAINEWVSRLGVKLSGELGSPDFDDAKEYANDGPIVHAIDQLDGPVVEHAIIEDLHDDDAGVGPFFM